MIHTALTVYSVEGVMVLVIVYTLGIAFLVFYYKWHKAVAELKKYRHSLGDERNVKTSNPTADTKPINFGQTEPSSNASDATAPMTAPPIVLRRMPFANAIKAKLIKLHGRHQSN